MLKVFHLTFFRFMLRILGTYNLDVKRGLTSLQFIRIFFLLK